MRARLSEIDGLRGVAALSVMLGHWGEAIQERGAPIEWFNGIQALFLDYWSFGRLGIVAFFCVSGFVVPFSFRGPKPMVAFPISRAFRLYPAYWVSIFLAAAVLPITNGIVFSPQTIAANMTMIQRILFVPQVLSVYWTLFIELIFYSVCYVMFGLRLLHSARANFVMMCFFLAIAVAGGCYRFVHPESDIPIGLPTYLAAMHFGTLARLRTLEHSEMPRGFYPLALTLLIGAVLTANTAAYLYAQNELVGWVAANLGYMAGLGLFLLTIHRRWFRGAIAAYFGLISYSLYLLHMIIVALLIWLWPFPSNWQLSAAICTALYFPLTIGLAALVQRFVEKPAIKAGRFLENKVVARLQPSTA